MEQDTAGKADPDRPAQPDAHEHFSCGDDDATWGRGSATAMDKLRQRNFRGRGPMPIERPSSE